MRPPVKSLLDKDFIYTPAKSTDAEYLRAKFKTIREALAKEEAGRQQVVAKTTIKRKP